MTEALSPKPQYVGADTGKKMNLLKISRFPDFILCLPDFSQRFPDFSPTKFFKVRKCERCGILNPRLSMCHGLWSMETTNQNRTQGGLTGFLCRLFTDTKPDAFCLRREMSCLRYQIFQI